MYWAIFFRPRFSAASAASIEAVRSQGFWARTSSQWSSISDHFCDRLAEPIRIRSGCKLQAHHPADLGRVVAEPSTLDPAQATGGRPGSRARACTPPCTSGPRRRHSPSGRHRCHIRRRPSPCPVARSDPTPQPSSRPLNGGPSPGEPPPGPGPTISSPRPDPVGVLPYLVTEIGDLPSLAERDRRVNRQAIPDRHRPRALESIFRKSFSEKCPKRAVTGDGRSSRHPLTINEQESSTHRRNSLKTTRDGPAKFVGWAGRDWRGGVDE